MRTLPAILVLLTVCTLSAPASSVDDKIPDQQGMDALEARAAQAQPREQCFLYAELVHAMVEVSTRQYASGEVEKATSLLKRAQEFTQKIHVAVAMDDKRLKDAQILLRHTAFRLNELLHASSPEDRPLMAETLTKLNAVQTETMLAVFKK